MIKNKYKKIQNELIDMWKSDQQAIKNGNLKEIKEIKEITKDNTQKLKMILKKIGWPTISKVGQKASRSAWFIVQHSVNDQKFQKKCLNLMKKQKLGDVKIQDIAYLEDRVLVGEKKKQIYGTQFYIGKDKKIKPRPIIKIEELDKRRKAVKLPPFSEYKKQMEKLYN